MEGVQIKSEKEENHGDKKMNTLKLPDHLRKELKEPFGILTTVDKLKINPGIVICVGDKTCELVLKSGIMPKICVYDGKVMRKNILIPDIIKEFDAIETHIKNPAAHLTQEAFDALSVALSSNQRVKIVVDGEEDLVALAAVHLAPEGSFVLYGQPHEGLVVVKVDKNVKEKVNDILGRMHEV